MRGMGRGMALWIAVIALSIQPVGAVDVILRWNRTLEDAKEDLRSGRFRDARTRMIYTTREMTKWLGPGRPAEESLGAVLALRAVAEEGLGKHEDALWYWYLAVALHPALENLDFGEFGAPGRALNQHHPSRDHCASDPSADPLDESEIEPPVVKHREPIDYPEGASRFEVSGDLGVVVHIDAEGRVSCPRVTTPLPAPTLTFAALEAVKHWRFRPARRNGKPIRVDYTLTVRYSF